jgi:hypothetical protein
MRLWRPIYARKIITAAELISLCSDNLFAALACFLFVSFGPFGLISIVATMLMNRLERQRTELEALPVNRNEKLGPFSLLRGSDLSSSRYQHRFLGLKFISLESNAKTLLAFDAKQTPLVFFALFCLLYVA